MPFAVTHTSGPKAKKSLNKDCFSPLSLSPRPDLDMKAQRRVAYLDSREDLQKALMKDYETTVGSRSKHVHFLCQILSEVQRYQVETFGNRIPHLALELMAEEMADEVDYAKCLSKISRRRVYSSEFIFTAVQMVKNHHQQRQLGTVTTADFAPSSSQALMRGGMVKRLREACEQANKGDLQT